MTARILRVGWVRQSVGEYRPCAKNGRSDQRCSGSARYRIEVESRGETWEGWLCGNHLAAAAPVLGIDVTKINEWKDFSLTPIQPSVQEPS